MTKRRSGDSMNRSDGFAFRNMSELNIMLRRHIRLVTKSCKMTNFEVMYDLQAKIMMNCYSIRSECRLRKSEYVRCRIGLVRMKAEEENDFLKISKSLIEDLSDIDDKFIYQSCIHPH